MADKKEALKERFKTEIVDAFYNEKFSINEIQEQILDYHPVTTDFLDIIADSEIPDYPEATEVPLKLLGEVDDYFRQPTGEPNPEVSIDRLHERYGSIPTAAGHDIDKARRHHAAGKIIRERLRKGNHNIRGQVQPTVRQENRSRKSPSPVQKEVQEIAEMEELKQKPEEELMFKTVPWLKQIAIAYPKYGESRYAKERIRREIELWFKRTIKILLGK